jgi:hypothetical protein
MYAVYNMQITYYTPEKMLASCRCMEQFMLNHSTLSCCIGIHHVYMWCTSSSTSVCIDHESLLWGISV